MTKILYLLAGVALKQAVDELKTIQKEYVDYLKRYRERTGFGLSLSRSKVGLRS